MRNKRVKKCLIHAIAGCQDCHWEEQDYKIAQKEGKKHAKKTGHTVIIDEGYYIIYNEKKGE